MKHEHRLNRQVAKSVAKNLKDSLQEKFDCGHSRSAKASLVALSLQLSGFKQMLHQPERLEKALTEAAQVSAAPFVVPQEIKNQGDVMRQTIGGVPVVVLNASAKNDQIFVFLFGGAYFLQPTKDHWHFAQRLAQQTNTRVLVPQYALAPTHQFTVAYDQLHRLYTALYQDTPVSRITLIGDSAGAGLAAGFCEWLGQHQMPQPGHLVLISPWLDLTLTNPLIAKYQQRDVVLDVDGLRRVGQIWAGTTPLDDYRLSPINGPVEVLKNVLIFAGTDEIMFPDIMKFVKMLRSRNVVVEAQIGRQLYHEFPLTPIPESTGAIRQIQQFCFD